MMKMQKRSGSLQSHFVLGIKEDLRMNTIRRQKYRVECRAIMLHNHNFKDNCNRIV